MLEEEVDFGSGSDREDVVSLGEEAPLENSNDSQPSNVSVRETVPDAVPPTSAIDTVKESVKESTVQASNDTNPTLYLDPPPVETNLPANWLPQRSTKTGQVYYRNMTTGKTTWRKEKIAGIDAAWEKEKAEDTAKAEALATVKEINKPEPKRMDSYRPSGINAQQGSTGGSNMDSHRPGLKKDNVNRTGSGSIDSYRPNQYEQDRSAKLFISKSTPFDLSSTSLLPLGTEAELRNKVDSYRPDQPKRFNTDTYRPDFNLGGWDDDGKWETRNGRDAALERSNERPFANADLRRDQQVVEKTDARARNKESLRVVDPRDIVDVDEWVATSSWSDESVSIETFGQVYEPLTVHFADLQRPALPLHTSGWGRDPNIQRDPLSGLTGHRKFQKSQHPFSTLLCFHLPALN